MTQAQVEAQIMEDLNSVIPTSNPGDSADIVKTAINEVFGDEDLIGCQEIVADNAEVAKLLDLNSDDGEPSTKRPTLDSDLPGSKVSGLDGKKVVEAGNKTSEAVDDDSIFYLHRFNSSPYPINSDGCYAVGSNRMIFMGSVICAAEGEAFTKNTLLKLPASKLFEIAAFFVSIFTNPSDQLFKFLMKFQLSSSYM